MKFIRRDYTAFVGIPSTRAGIQDFMCSEIADMIISSDTGWEYDTRTPNKEAFIRIPLTNYTQTTINPTPVLYLRNSVSGCKMMVCSVMWPTESGSVTTNMQPISQNIFVKGKGNTTINFASGIGISIIPPAVADEYPDDFTSSTEFGSNTLRVICECAGTGNTSQSGNNIGGIEQHLFAASGVPVISYGIAVDEYSVTLFGGAGSSTRSDMFSIFTIGKVLGTLAYDTEIPSQSYGSVRYTCVQGGQSGYSYVTGETIYQSITNAPSLAKAYYGAYVNYNSSYPTNFDYSTQCFRQDGTRIESCYYGISNGEMLSARITNSQSPDFIRWVPGIMFDSYSDTPIYEGGDGFKGYLDTNLIRYAIANKGQLFNNGQFCCVGINLLLKWDPDTTDTILA